MNHSFDSTRTTTRTTTRTKIGQIIRRVAALLASAFITFTLFHEVAMLGAPERDAAATQFAQSTTQLAQGAVGIPTP